MKRVNLALTNDRYKRVKILADAKGTSVTTMLNHLIEIGLYVENYDEITVKKGDEELRVVIL